MAYRSWFDGAKILYPEIGKEARFVIENEGRYLNNKCFFLPSSDWFLLAVLNSAAVFAYLKEVCALLGDKDDGGRLEFRAQYLETLPIPDAPDSERKAVGELAQKVQALHGQRRSRVERFLQEIGLAPAQSTSRNPLEQPWNLSAAEFAKRAKRQPLKIYEAARDETAALTEQISKLEAEIDARVATLYGLDAEDQRWAAKATPAAQPNDKGALFYRILGGLKDKAPYFPFKAIQAAVNDAELELEDSTLRGYLVEAVKQKLLHDAGRGWYSRLVKPFVMNTKPVAKLVKTLQKPFPLLDFTCWSTEQIHGYGHHLLAKFVSFIYTERDALDSVGERLRDEGWDVTVNPRGAAAQDFAIRSDRTVVIRPLTTTQPAENNQVTIEGLLVELFIEAKALNLMDAGEYLQLLENLAGQQRIRLATLLDYARERRPIGLELIEHINADFLKNSALVGS